MCKVSVIIPAYNAECYIETCVNSILNQTFQKLELIVVDDGSLDRTREVCEALAKGDSRIRLFHQQNAGPAAARNRGLENARGEWLVFVDADDWLESDCIRKAYDIAVKEQADIVLWNMQNEYASGRIQKEIPLDGDVRIYEKEKLSEIEDMMLTEQTERKSSFVNMTGPYCKLIQKSITEKCVFPEYLNSGEDACFVYQIVKNCRKLVYISDVFYNRIILQESLSNRFDEDFWNRRLGYVNWVLEFFRPLDSEKETAINDFCYENYKLVVMNYFLRNNSMRYEEKKRAVKRYREGVGHEIDYTKIHTEGKILCFFIQHDWFWCLCLMQLLKRGVKTVLRVERV